MASSIPTKIIIPEPITLKEYWREMVRYRGLIWVFAYQEIKTLYVQTYFGLFWAIIRPLVILSIFTILFNYLLKIHTHSPYYLFAFSGMIAWNFFQQITATASGAVIQRQDLIRKMYFPKLILPLAKVLVAGVELMVSLGIIFVMLCYERYPVSASLFALPVFLFLNIITGLSVALWMNALNIRHRDLNQIVGPLISIGIWFTPVFFPTTIIPEQYHWLVYLNPMAGVIEGFRFSLLGEAFLNKWYFASIITIAVVFLAGIWYLARVEDQIVDYG